MQRLHSRLGERSVAVIGGNLACDLVCLWCTDVAAVYTHLTAQQRRRTKQAGVRMVKTLVVSGSCCVLCMLPPVSCILGCVGFKPLCCTLLQLLNCNLITSSCHVVALCCCMLVLSAGGHKGTCPAAAASGCSTSGASTAAASCGTAAGAAEGYRRSAGCCPCGEWLLYHALRRIYLLQQ